jgi:hypothetical protein
VRGRTASEKIELRFPGLAALGVLLLGKAPGPVRRRALRRAFARAEAAFNRGDFDALFAMFADNVEYVPPPALSEATIHGKHELLRFWNEVLSRYPEGEITNLDLEEATPTRFIRTIRVVHRARDEQRLRYDLRQTTELERGRVVRQVNRALLS